MAFLLISVLIFVFTPTIQFNDPYSTILEDKNAKLLAGMVAADGQWRFPESDSVPKRYKTALLLFEDQYFDYHLGFNPLSILKAAQSNIQSGKIKRGGSTITMQLARIARKEKERTYFGKLLELLMAIKAEIIYSKAEILNLYASHAPFGGNVVGLETASWCYFGLKPHQLTWAETATLAVLPNSPALIYPGKNQEKLLVKRNKLLDKLFEKGYFNDEELTLAKAEKIPSKPEKMPKTNPHLLTRVLNDGLMGQKVTSTIDFELQKRCNMLIDRYYKYFSSNGVNNAAMLIIDNKTGDILTYIGNVAKSGIEHGNNVDIVMSPRSYGSLLKPILYVALIEEGSILPEMLVDDFPVTYNGFVPQNFLKDFDGVVPVNEVLSRSLNVPSVNLLRKFGSEKFLRLNKDLGITTFTKPANHYGLSIILGGAEANLWELAGLYAALGNKLKTGKNDFSIQYSNIVKGSFHQKKYQIKALSQNSIWATFNAITANRRPVTQTNWEFFQSSQKIAWKTGTSFGFRDAWAIGVTQDYTVAVWVGNANGEGRSGLIGVSVAAPIMFDVFGFLPKSLWFPKPTQGLKTFEICAKSGFKAGENCEQKVFKEYPKQGEKTGFCNFHQAIFLDETEKFRVNADCYPNSKMKIKNYFLLSPEREFFYKIKHADYQNLPDWLSNCKSDNFNKLAMQFIYPQNFAKIVLPKSKDGVKGKAVFEVAHRKDNITLFWHVDNEFIGKTTHFHKMEVSPTEGKHIITVVDENGESITRRFEIL